MPYGFAKHVLASAWNVRFGAPKERFGNLQSTYACAQFSFAFSAQTFTQQGGRDINSTASSL